MPLFSLPQQYAGNSIYVDFYDVGDICPSCSINVDVNILTPPSGSVAAGTAAQPVTVNDLGTSRRSATTPTPINNPGNKATFRATTAGTQLYPGRWVEMVIPVPGNYNPGPSDTWSLEYEIRGSPKQSANAHDTLTVAVGLFGSPAHLVSG